MDFVLLHIVSTGRCYLGMASGYGVMAKSVFSTCSDWRRVKKNRVKI